MGVCLGYGEGVCELWCVCSIPPIDQELTNLKKKTRESCVCVWGGGAFIHMQGHNRKIFLRG